ncbi:MAG: hypothetical protein P4L59_15460 [Desulfosporosinus sp.]|nr:hypothetical protein [Desulfosporosinus sp.]
MKQVLIIASKEFKTAFKDKVFLVITALFLLLSIISVYIGSSTKNAEVKAYLDIVALLKAQGATNFPLSPQLFPLAIRARYSRTIRRAIYTITATRTVSTEPLQTRQYFRVRSTLQAMRR